MQDLHWAAGEGCAVETFTAVSAPAADVDALTRRDIFETSATFASIEGA